MLFAFCYLFMNYPLSIQNLIESFSKLPTIGRKSAERFVFFLLKRPQEELDAFANALLNLKKGVSYCHICGCISETDPCSICSNSKRNTEVLCIVSATRDMVMIESTKMFNGKYHVLNGNIDTAKNITPEQLNIKSLLQRLSQPPIIKEIILALSPTFEGETTALYLTKILKDYNIKITRLARGLPTGADIEYADESTLVNALTHRY